ncbi:diaminopimelate epimerase [Alkalibacter mobilis]|uniref:diaminopimelate epimerase n=1 Tax=Alkalibacter mobilis TaxID=2787712 RepID=UPI00189CD85F|nr:diaminopimelate epimerase [Alkalibacter mobilis]MBF7095864.1 diaminopimelate epimerase [Alkalibacter mobilis]
MVKINFSKYHGTGNDFIIVENLDKRISLSQDAIAKMCDRHFGIGADGFLLVEKSDSSDIKMVYHNSDGSLAAMCGNGIRCFAKHVYDNGILDNKIFTVETPAGEKIITIEELDGCKASKISVDMGPAIFETEKIGVVTTEKQLIDFSLQTEFGDILLSAVSMGNPHGIIQVDDMDSYPIEKIGPFVEKNKLFSHGANVNFAQILDRKNIRVTTWERGSGLTLACGTGSCASVALLNKKQMIDEKVNVKTPGGILTVEVGDTVIMTGPAIHVFEGKISFAEEEF